MPVWNARYILPDQTDTFKIISDFSYLKSGTADGITQITRTSEIETNLCKQTLKLKYYVTNNRIESIRTDKLTYRAKDTLFLIAHGMLYTHGDCKPQVHWGIEKLENTNWVNLVDLKFKGKNTCGPGHYEFKKQKEAIAILRSEYDADFFPIKAKGIYRFYTWNLQGERINSNQFIFE